MQTIVVACQTLRDELSLAIKECGVNYPVIYIESGLHNKPELLHRRVQDQLNMIDNVDVILMAFGYCGNSMLEIQSSRFKIVIPRVDDCISLLLGSVEVRRRTSQGGTYYLTKGWLDSERNIIGEYEHCVAKYGEKRALRITKTMLAHYKRLMLINTGAYSVKKIMVQTQKFADRLNLHHEIIMGSPRLLHKLLVGSWDKEFIVLEPGQKLTFSDICHTGSQLAAAETW